MLNERVQIKAKRDSRFFENKYYMLIPRMSISAYYLLFEFIATNNLKIIEIKEDSMYYWVNLGLDKQTTNHAANFINENQ